MGIPFSLPLIDQSVVDEVVDALTNTGWITSGPKVQEFEQAIADYTGSPAAIAVNSWTSGAMVVLRWLGVGPGDEVIVPAYTYSATALAVMNLGAKPVMVDVEAPFHLAVDRLSTAITSRTKAIIPVDLGGWPCDYKTILEVVLSSPLKSKFQPNNAKQETLGRPLIIADAAHSLGADFEGVRVGSLTDVSVFSFHSVKNLTTGEGGMICLNLPKQFDTLAEQRILKYLALNGQTKSALEKSTVGGWQYDIVDQGFKANMPDLCAAIGLAQLRQYDQRMLPDRKRLFQVYNNVLQEQSWAILPTTSDGRRTSSYHLYQLRIDGIGESTRNRMMQLISEKGCGVNVHYVPMPMLTLFRDRGYNIADFPVSFDLYQNEITLPVYNNLSSEDAQRVVEAVVAAHGSVSLTV
ncbi:MAG: DegT/DnrJ/EryC1/StrS family aminotransferase [Gammaproteobacteria bacterium]|nr:DegT/DnrJ/EryC1/StrS family aminotransferase [Gammaproteobacteria bacterium]